MVASPESTASALLNGACAAHIRGDVLGLRVLLRAASTEVSPLLWRSVVVLSTAEHLRAVAHARGMEPAELMPVLARACGKLLGPGETADLLADCARVLTDPDAVVLPGRASTRPWEVVMAGVRLTSAALVWRCRDCGLDPARTAGQVCLRAAAREQPPTTGRLDPRTPPGASSQ